jgi:cell wall-associated NlpC family hydrolase
MHRRTYKLRYIIATLLSVAALLFAVAPWQAGASETAGGHALDWAEANATGHWYAWGGTGPSYDCSGLVYESFLHEGINVGRDTYDMLHNSHLVRTYSPQRGDLAFYGTGHVEFVTIWWHTTFGALNYGTRVGWHVYYPPWWQPTMYFRVVS